MPFYIYLSIHTNELITRVGLPFTYYQRTLVSGSDSNLEVNEPLYHGTSTTQVKFCWIRFFLFSFYLRALDTAFGIIFDPNLYTTKSLLLFFFFFFTYMRESLEQSFFMSNCYNDIFIMEVIKMLTIGLKSLYVHPFYQTPTSFFDLTAFEKCKRWLLWFDNFVHLSWQHTRPTQWQVSLWFISAGKNDS